MSDLDDLRAIAPPPAQPSPRPDLQAARDALGVDLPADYAALAETYGSGSFGGFLWLLVPGAGNPNLELVRQAELRLADLRAVQADGEELPYEPRVAAGGLLPWAITDNGDTAYWRIDDPAAPDGWTVVVNEGRGPDWHAFDGGAPAFLAAWLSGRERVSVFPDDVPEDPPGFTPLG